MREIEKLYKNAGVGYLTYVIDTFPPVEYPQIDFTAEKQLELIKLLSQQCDLAISYFGEWEFIHFDGQESTQITGKDFTETFAKLINAYWKNLADEEKAKIKEILNG